MGRRVNEEEVVSDVIEGMADRMVDVVEKVIDDGVAIDPVIVVTSVEGDSGVRRPINR